MKFNLKIILMSLFLGLMVPNLIIAGRTKSEKKKNENGCKPKKSNAKIKTRSRGIRNMDNVVIDTNSEDESVYPDVMDINHRLPCSCENLAVLANICEDEAKKFLMENPDQFIMNYIRDM